MLNEPSDSPRKNTPEPRSPAWTPNRGIYNVPSQDVPSSPPLQSQPTPSIRRPGCVTATAAVFFLISLVSVLGLLQSLLLFDVLLLIVNAAQIALVLAIVYGLMEMVRWGANLVIIWCAGTILQSILQAILMSFLISDYLESSLMETTYIIGTVIVSFAIVVLIGLIMYWYVRVRKWFSPGDLPQKIEHRLYVIAIVIVLVSTVVSLSALPEVLESQSSLFEDLNSQTFESR
jgi:hypothetical protein